VGRGSSAVAGVEVGVAGLMVDFGEGSVGGSGSMGAAPAWLASGPGGARLPALAPAKAETGAAGGAVLWPGDGTMVCEGVVKRKHNGL